MLSNLIKAPFRIWLRVLEAEVDLAVQAVTWVIDRTHAKYAMSSQDVADWTAIIDLISEARRQEREQS
jgi:hypothetical protein